MSKKSNHLVVIKYLNWNEKYPRGELMYILGECGDWEAEKKALLWQYSPYYFKKNIEVPNPISIRSYLDITDWETLNIDPENCEDIDDCVSYKIFGNSLKIAITISNVSRLVDFDSSVDKQAFLLSETMYSTNERKSMLPVQYEQECSLTLGKERYGLSLFFDYSLSEKNITNIKFVETKIINKKSYTYETIYNSEHTHLLDFLKSFSNSEDSHKWVEEEDEQQLWKE
jgi:exoribonuclease R